MKLPLIAVCGLAIFYPLSAQDSPENATQTPPPTPYEIQRQQAIADGRAEVERRQRQADQLALIKAQADAAADAQIRVNQKGELEKSIARAEAEYPESTDPKSSLYKANLMVMTSSSDHTGEWNAGEPWQAVVTGENADRTKTNPSAGWACRHRPRLSLEANDSFLLHEPILGATATNPIRLIRLFLETEDTALSETTRWNLMVAK